MRVTILLIGIAMAVVGLSAEIRVHETSGKQLPHTGYLEVVSQSESPLQRLYVKTGDGLYVAATMRKPRGEGPFPAMLVLHGAPGGRGMEQLVNWSLGKCGGPVWEGLLQEGYVVVVGDYRGSLPSVSGPVAAEAPAATPANAMATDALAILDHMRSLPFIDTGRIGVYGVSLGGDVALHVAARAPVRALVLGAPAARNFLGAQRYASGERMDDYSNQPPPPMDAAVAKANVAALGNETLLLVGTKDALLPLTKLLYQQLISGGKTAELHIYRNGYHDFPMGPQCHDPVRFPQPFIDATEHSLGLTMQWLKRVMR
ncbi:MAG: prolyl oligopeptidase family serine peptidase [Bryobacterales bacterium]|jgi:dipeptidyl-peptidase-4|nr:prolyl oligopeptidase family serine peptidase [Bryobacterales bacterium]